MCALTFSYFVYDLLCVVCNKVLLYKPQGLTVYRLYPAELSPCSCIAVRWCAVLQLLTSARPQKQPA